MLIQRRAHAIPAGNRRNVKVIAAGFNAGAANITASDGPRWRDRSYTDEKRGAAQQEQSINGVPDAPASSWRRT
jgi:hypothetical protein